MASDPLQDIRKMFEYAPGCPILIDVRALLLIVPAAMLLMRAIIGQSMECVIAWLIVGVLSFNWMHARMKKHGEF